MTSNKKIPIVIVSGFLGSGKTSLINYIIKHSPDKNFGLIVNDFGDINIDGYTLNAVSSNIAEFSNGCICCQITDSELSEVFDEFTKESSNIDAIIIESSGIAEPIDIKKSILYSKNKQLLFNGIIYVVDAINYLETIKDNPEIERHTQSADLIVLNKTDQIDDKNIKKLFDNIKSTNTHATITKTSYGAIDPEAIFDVSTKKNAIQVSLFSETDHIHNKFNSVSFDDTRPLNYKKFIKFIKKKDFYRAKGFAYFGVKGFEQKIVFHKVGNYIHQNADQWDKNETPCSKFVVIGQNIDKTKTKSDLNKLIDDNTNSDDSDEFVDIMRLMGY